MVGSNPDMTLVHYSPWLLSWENAKALAATYVTVCEKRARATGEVTHDLIQCSMTKCQGSARGGKVGRLRPQNNLAENGEGARRAYVQVRDSRTVIAESSDYSRTLSSGTVPHSTTTQYELGQLRVAFNSNPFQRGAIRRVD